MDTPTENTLSYYFADFLRERVEDGSIDQDQVESHLAQFILFFDAIKAHLVTNMGDTTANSKHFPDIAFVLLTTMLTGHATERVSMDTIINFVKVFSPTKIIETHNEIFRQVSEAGEDFSAGDFIPLVIKRPATETELSATITAVSQYLFKDVIPNKTRH